MASPQSLFTDAPANTPSSPTTNPAASALSAAKLLTEREAAAVLSISPRLLWQLRQDGHIPCIRIGRAVRYTLADLIAWVDAQRSQR